MAQLAAMPQQNGLANIAQLLQQLAPVFFGTGQQTQSGNQTTGGTTSQSNTQTSATAPDILAQIQQLLGQVQQTGQQFTRDQAIADSSGAINTTILDAIRANMPSVLAGQKGAGLYNDTTTSLLQNDLMARIAGEASKAQTNTIQQYGQLATQNQNTAANLLSQLAQANRTQTQNQTQTQTENRTTTQQTQTAPVVPRGVSAGGVGVLGALSALKQGKDLFSGTKDFFSGLLGGSDSPISPAADIAFGAFDPSGLNFGSFSDFGSSFSLPDFGTDFLSSGAADTIGNFAGVGNDLSGVFTSGGGDTLNSLGSSIDFTSDLGNLSSAAGGFSDFGGLFADLGKRFTDTLGDFGGSVGDFFGGFFADGGYVSKQPPNIKADPMQSLISNFEVNKLPAFIQMLADGGLIQSPGADFGIYADGGKVSKKGLSPRNVPGYADGGIVEDTPKAVQRGRAGGRSYTREGAEAKASGGFGNLQRMRALWESLATPGANPNFGAPSVVAGNEDALSGANRGTGAMLPELARLQELANGREARISAQQDQQIASAIQKVEAALKAQEDAAPSTALKDTTQSVSQARSAYKIGDRMVSASAPTVATVGDIGVASQLGGAGAALGGSAISAGGSLGTVDALGSLAGNAFLPTYSAASGAAGTGASSALFGSGATGGAAASPGLGAAVSGAGTVLAVPLIASALFDRFLPDQTPIEAWQKMAANIAGFPTDPNGVGNVTGIFSLFDPTNPENRGLSKDSMFNNAVGKLQDAGWWQQQAQLEAQRGGYAGASSTDAQYLPAILPYVMQVAKYLRDTNKFDELYYRNALKTQLSGERGITARDDSIFGDGSNKRKQQELDEEVARMSLDQVYGALANNQNILAPGQLSGPGGGPQAILAADQLAAAGIPDSFKGFGGVGGSGVDPATGLQFADGGMIGSRVADPKGNKDNIPILASEGEYVIPKPVVDALGQPFFDGLLQAFNIPSAVR